MPIRYGGLLKIRSSRARESHTLRTMQPENQPHTNRRHLPPRPHSEQVIRSSLSDSCRQIPHTAVSLCSACRFGDGDDRSLVVIAFIDGDDWSTLFVEPPNEPKLLSLNLVLPKLPVLFISWEDAILRGRSRGTHPRLLATGRKRVDFCSSFFWVSLKLAILSDD